MTSVTPHPVAAPPAIDFDHHSATYCDHWQIISDEHLAACPIARSTAYGGFWLFSGYSAVAEASHDGVTYSSFHDLTGEINGYEGVLIPPSVYPSPPLELDPPESLRLRAVLAPDFTPRAVRRLEPFTRAATDDCLDRHAATGRIDLVRDLANPIPAMVAMKILGLPLDRWPVFAAAAHESGYRTPGAPDFEQTLGNLQHLVGLLMDAIDQRRRAPHHDLLGRLVRAADRGGRRLDDATILNTVILMLAGVDAVTALTANALLWLSRHPTYRRRLATEPGLIPLATEEFLRFFTPLQAFARTVTRDTELDGQRLRAGDRVLLSFAAANRDRRVFAAPGEVRLDRFPNPHAAFGFGAHRCVGADLARAQFRVMLTAVLARMPEYEVDAASVERYPSIGVTNGYVAMPATFQARGTLGR